MTVRPEVGKMSCSKAYLMVVSVTLLVAISAGDVMVQLNVNRPFNDVSDKFVSFAMKPEDLYKALDGPHRKTMTRLAAILGDSYIKFLSDYGFAVNGPSKLRNPTRVIWKGFNRWSRAVNWTMIVPIPYTPATWDPMQALKILNTSYMNGISECIWQLGVDFSSTSAKEYVDELNTLNLMVESFKPYVEDWHIMGADISPGSSAEETKRYIEMTKDVNAAYGWTQPLEVTPSNTLGSYIYDNDPALKTLLSNKAPVWLNLAQPASRVKTKRSGNVLISDETVDGLRWAQTLGDAASGGFDVIFKRITPHDLEKPDYSFFVTAVFKKVMGSRVFPARPLGTYKRGNKLYTHCANTVSGGIAFMVINADQEPLQISLRSLAAMTGSEMWQYTLTSKKGAVYLNGNELSVNSTLTPQVRFRKRESSMQLSTPEQSVSFCVLPKAGLEHCQYTEIESTQVETETASQKTVEKRASSADKLLRKLIQESAMPNSPLARVFSRRRRYTTAANRPKRFVLENKSEKVSTGLSKFFEPLAVFDDKKLQKREDTPNQPLKWLKDLMGKSLKAEMPILKRATRSTDDRYFGPFFMNRDGKKTTITKKIFEIRKPERKAKPVFNFEDFDEEKFFKKISEHAEPEPVYVPEGDVHLRLITNPEGEVVEDEEAPKKTAKRSQNAAAIELTRDTKNEMKPLRLLPTEFYEALPSTNLPKMPMKKLYLGGALNSLLFPEQSAKRLEQNEKAESAKVEEETRSGEIASPTVSAEDFLRAQIELGKTFLKDIEGNIDDKEEESKEKTTEKAITAVTTETPKAKVKQVIKKPNESKKQNAFDFWNANGETLFKEVDESLSLERISKVNKNDANHEDIPWWDLTTFYKEQQEKPAKPPLPRVARSLRYGFADVGDWRMNMIDKDDELTPLGAMNAPEQLSFYEYEVKNENHLSGSKTNDISEPRPDDEEIHPRELFKNVKDKVTKLVSIFTRHVGKWYNTLTKHFEEAVETTTPAQASQVITYANNYGNIV